ncbi:hypothetical protein ACXWOU_10000, partial [Streptococcus pyogenes]
LGINNREKFSFDKVTDTSSFAASKLGPLAALVFPVCDVYYSAARMAFKYSLGHNLYAGKL